MINPDLNKYPCKVDSVVARLGYRLFDLWDLSWKWLPLSVSASIYHFIDSSEYFFGICCRFLTFSGSAINETKALSALAPSFQIRCIISSVCCCCRQAVVFTLWTRLDPCLGKPYNLWMKRRHSLLKSAITASMYTSNKHEFIELGWLLYKLQMFHT